MIPTFSRALPYTDDLLPVSVITYLHKYLLTLISYFTGPTGKL